MSWQTTLARALTAMKREEAVLARELGAIRSRIGQLASLARVRSKPGKRRKLSAKARAAISRAQRKRWAAYRAKTSARE